MNRAREDARPTRHAPLLHPATTLRPTGAWERGVAEKTITKVSDVLGVDDDHGIVFGFAIVCTKDGEDYYDLNVDDDGLHKGKAVPEHITEDAMLKAVVDATLPGTHLEGDEMHAGPNTGSYPFMFPLTAEIAKALGITTERTGLLCGYRPEASVLAKFKDGTYTGFSITGARLDGGSEEVPDA
jgi:hypothetical protein